MVTTRLPCTKAVPPASTVNVAAALPLPTTKLLPLLSAAFSTLKFPPLNSSWPPLTRFRLLAVTAPASIWNVPPLFTHNVEPLPAPVTLTVAPLTTSQPPLAAR